MTASKYPLIRSTLEGIFGAQVALDDQSAMDALRRDLEYVPFRKGIREELRKAFSDDGFRWLKVLDECDVGGFDTEDEAELFVRRALLNVIDAAPDD